MKFFITRIVLKARQVQQWLVAYLVFGLLSVFKLFPADGSIRFADWVMRKIGPFTGRHKLILENLHCAFPDKDEAEITRIALESWGHIGRLAAEYVFLDELFDFDPDDPGWAGSRLPASNVSGNCSSLIGHSSCLPPTPPISKFYRWLPHLSG
nr:hypothetical protein [Marinicella sp. W31]MDC2876786.1 hypothetical protein [Marinicella sp. W31]